jgi:hypothetical protein
MRVLTYALLAVSACGGVVFAPVLSAQSQTQPPVGAAQTPDGTPQDATPQDATAPDAGRLPLSPVEQRDKEIRQVDPLDRGNQDGKDSSKAEKRNAQDQTPLPGSIAASEQNSAPRSGPQVVGDGDDGEPVQEYSGPAVLSRSYSINQAMVPQQLQWRETVGVSSVYDSGISRIVNADGSFGPASTLLGTQVSWSFSGKHYFHRDQVSVSYSGNMQQYSGAGSYSGSNQAITASYTHFLSRRLILNLSGSGSIYAQNYGLENQPVGPETIANINIATSPNIQIYDEGGKQFSSQADLTWQASNRLSFSFGTSYFGLEQNSALLIGTSGQQARADVNYRLTRKTTIGTYYSFSHYLYTQGFGTSDINTAGLIYSYALNRTTQFRFRGGLSEVESLGLETVRIDPAIAVLLGQASGFIDARTTYRTTDFSAQFVKDFRGRATASLAYARGISPGNGLYLTSQQESISGNLTAKVFRNYSLTLGVGRDTLGAAEAAVSTEAVALALGKYESVYGRISLAKTYKRGVGLSFTAEYRHFDIDILGELRNQLRITSGLTWGSGNGRLWPF